VLAVVLSFKLAWAPPNDLVSGQGLEVTLERLTDLSRHALVARRAGAELLQVAGPLLFLLPLQAAALGWAPPGHATRAAGLALLAIVAGYYLVYVTSPRDLVWHLENSASRLVLHLWPAAVVILFASTRALDERLLEATEPVGMAPRG
jgi:hypothetical protein